MRECFSHAHRSARLALLAALIMSCTKVVYVPGETIIEKETETITDTVYIHKDFVREEIPASQCSVMNLNGDAVPDATNGAVVMTGDELFDGKWMSGFHRWTEVNYHFYGWTTEDDHPWFTFDIGEYAKLYELAIMPYWGFRSHDPAMFELWAYTSPGLPASTTSPEWKNNSAWVCILEADISELYDQTLLLDAAPEKVGDPRYDPCVEGAHVLIGGNVEKIPEARYYRFVIRKNFNAAYGQEAGYGWTQRAQTCTISELRLWKYGEKVVTPPAPEREIEPSKCRDLMLYYCGGPHRSNHETVPSFTDYLLSDEEEPRWLFDGALLLEQNYSAQYSYMGETTTRICCKLEHIYPLWDNWFNTILPRLDRNVGECKAQTQSTIDTEKVVLMLTVLPFLKDYEGWGSVPGVGAENWRDWEYAMSVYRWQIDELIRRFDSGGFENLELTGIYWPDEAGGLAPKHLTEICEYARSKGLKVYFIPYFSERFERALYSCWKDYGFDYTYLQPNYFFNLDIPKTRLYETCELAHKYGMGLEMEFSPSNYYDERLDRMEDYLDVFEEMGVFDYDEIAYYQTIQDFVVLKRGKDKDPYGYSLYRRLSDFVAKRHEEFYNKK